MRKQKYYLYLTVEERLYISNALLSYHNKRIAQGRYTDAVDEVMIKIQKQASAAVRNLCRFMQNDSDFCITLLKNQSKSRII